MSGCPLQIFRAVSFNNISAGNPIYNERIIERTKSWTRARESEDKNGVIAFNLMNMVAQKLVEIFTKLRIRRAALGHSSLNHRINRNSFSVLFLKGIHSSFPLCRELHYLPSQEHFADGRFSMEDYYTCNNKILTKRKVRRNTEKLYHTDSFQLADHSKTN